MGWEPKERSAKPSFPIGKPGSKAISGVVLCHFYVMLLQFSGPQQDLAESLPFFLLDPIGELVHIVLR